MMNMTTGMNQISGMMDMMSSKCKLIENAKNDPNWDDSLNAELCPGECSTKCPHYLTQIPSEVLDNKEARNIEKKIWPIYFQEILEGIYFGAILKFPSGPLREKNILMI